MPRIFVPIAYFPRFKQLGRALLLFVLLVMSSGTGNACICTPMSGEFPPDCVFFRASTDGVYDGYLKITSGGSVNFPLFYSDSFPIPSFDVVQDPSQCIGMPAGISFDPNTYLVSGTAPKGGRYRIEIDATQTVAYCSGASWDFKPRATYQLTVHEPPKITGNKYGTVLYNPSIGSQYFQIPGSFIVTGYPPPRIEVTVKPDIAMGATDNKDCSMVDNDCACRESNVPIFLSLNNRSCGLFNVTLKATTTDISGNAVSDELVYALTINDAPILVYNSDFTPILFEVGSYRNFIAGVYGCPKPKLSYTGSLPKGLSFTPNEILGTPSSYPGSITGAPQPGSGGKYTISVTANNGNLPDYQQNVEIVVNEAPAITSSSTLFTEGVFDSLAVAAKGYPLSTLRYSGSLPSGLYFDSNNGMISGTPDQGSTGKYTILIFASNGVSPDAMKEMVISVTPVPVDGACGLSNGKSFITAPASDLCIDGLPGLLPSGSGPWQWVCPGTKGKSSASCSAAISSHSLTASVTGTGNVTSDPQNNGAIACTGTGSGCSTTFDHNATVKVTATPSAASAFSKWGGACSGTEKICSIVMDGDKGIAATFNDHPPLRMTGTTTTYLAALSEVKAAISGMNSTTLQVLATTLNDGFTLDQPLNLTFDGGYNSGFASNAGAGMTVILGGVTVRSGKLTVNKLAVN